MSADIAAELNADTAARPAPLFVINLCASTSPMALTHPNTPELKRFTFFVSRQREEGRERFRLHMGYFASQEEAESLLAAVRDVYPAAWAGPAPTSGVPRRARALTVPPMIAASATAVATAAPTARPPVVAPVIAPVVPVVMAAPAAAQPPHVAAPAAAAKPAQSPAAVKNTPVLETMSNVRTVLAQLDGERAAPVVKSPVVAARTDVAAPATKPAVPATPVVPAVQLAPAAQVAPPAPARAAPPAAAQPRKDTKELDASQTLKVLEAAAPVASVDMEEDLPDGPEVRIVTPEDTQTLRDINLDAQNNAPPCFAVQLVWAVTPIDVASLPHLAIFDAYTLYNVEGSRQGRKWYGLRLGFFSDPNSATQVAHYVRSDYQAVAVVPVAIKERDNARGGTRGPVVAARLGEAGAPQKPQDDVPLQGTGLDGFELLLDDRPAPEKRDVDDMGSRAAPRAPATAAAAVPKLARDRIAAAAAANVAARPAPAAASNAATSARPVAKPTGKPTGKRVVVRKRPQPSRAAPGAPQPLESTLEILGASTLSLDKNSREIVNDSAIREPIEKKQASRFSKLLNRLSGG